MGTIRIRRDLFPPGWHSGLADERAAGAACERRRRLSRCGYAATGLALGLSLWVVVSPWAVIPLGLGLAMMAVWLGLAWASPRPFSLERELRAELCHEALAWSALFGPGVLFVGAGAPLAMAVEELARAPQRGLTSEVTLYVGIALVAAAISLALAAFVAYRVLRARRIARELLAPGALAWAFGSTWAVTRFLNLVRPDGSAVSIQLAGDVALATALAALDTPQPSADYRAPSSRPFIGFSAEQLARLGEPPGMRGRRE